MKKRSEIGDRIKVLRESLSKSQVKFARLLKVSPPTVSRWEAGKVIPPTHVLIKLGNLATGESCGWFWERAGINSRAMMMLTDTAATKVWSGPRRARWFAFQPS